MFESSTKREIRQFHVVIVQWRLERHIKRANLNPFLFLPFSLLPPSSLLVPERPISANPALKFCSTFCIYLSMHWVTFCVIITISQSKGSITVCRKLELHVLRQGNLAQNLGQSWIKRNHLSKNWAVQSCCFTNLNLLLFCRSRCRRPSSLLKLPILFEHELQRYLNQNRNSRISPICLIYITFRDRSILGNTATLLPCITREYEH